VYPRHRLDIGAADLAYGLRACLGTRRRSREAAILGLCGLTGAGMVTYSVRSGWDLLLGALPWVPGDEVLVSAVTHPDMVALLTARGLQPVPVDLDLATLTPPVEELERARTSRTRGILVAHLFGVRADLRPVAAFAASHGLLLVADAAQSYAGPASVADPYADVAMVSFGMIKTATALGGGILAVKDPELLGRMRSDQRRWPVQRRTAYAARLVRTAGLVLLGRPGPYRLFVAACRRLGRSPDDLVNAATRSFPTTGAEEPIGIAPDLLSRLRHRPSAPLLALLERRLRTGDRGRGERRTAAGDQVAAALPAAMDHPGLHHPRRTHWIFPVRSDDPAGLVSALHRAGFDASPGTSNLLAIGVPGQPVPSRAVALMSRVVYLPVYPEIPTAARMRLIGVLHASSARRRQTARRVPPPLAAGRAMLRAIGGRRRLDSRYPRRADDPWPTG
jgi:dTDP-4-amino-4,6-dideoxygalactose transaminase